MLCVPDPLYAGGGPVSAVDVFRDVAGRPYAAGWRFDPAHPLEVQLHLTPGDGVAQVWRFARDWLAPDSVGAGGDVALSVSGERLVLALYPVTRQAKTLVGSSAVALEFLVATEALVPRCSGCPAPECVSCVRTRAGLDAALAEITRQGAP
ncbi:MAG: SsgA family sporulation/cell division regulator [Pseudonocardiaceae bacterium]